MDHINIEKLQAKNKYKKNQFLNTLILYSFTAMTFGLFCSSPFWFPSIFSSMKIFLFVSLPYIVSFIFNPKCLFIVCNVIVVFLIGESKLVGSKSSPATEIYEEYAKRSGGTLRRFPTIVGKKEREMKLEVSWVEDYVTRVAEQEVKEEKIVLEGEEEDEDSDREEELGLPVEEINKRTEDFIARFKKQGKLEFGHLVCSSA